LYLKEFDAQLHFILSYKMKKTILNQHPRHSTTTIIALQAPQPGELL
jgi:hypothetical protein